MSFLIATPDMLGAAAADVAGIGSSLSEANAAAATSTTAVVAAADDEVSAAIASLFSSHGTAFQALSAQAAAFHNQFVQALNGAGSAYAAAEAANASPLAAAVAGAQSLAVFSPVAAATGRPAIGNGANGTTNAQGVGTPGGPGGWLYGNGGRGGNSTADWEPGGAGGSAGLIGNGGTGGIGGPGAPGGPGGSRGLLLGTNGATGAAGATIPPAAVSVHVVNEEPMVDISIGGQNMSVVVDTGSAGLVIPATDVNAASLGAPTGSGSTTYGTSPDTETYQYTTYTTPVNFGNGIITAPTTVDVVTSATRTINGVTTTIPLSQVTAIMGIGVNAGPSTSPVQALPGVLSEGVLINEPAGVLQFGANPLPVGASVSGAPWTQLEISINGGAFQSVTGAVDSGGLYGSVSQNLVPGSPQVGSLLPAGETIQVDTSNGNPLYIETVGTYPTAPYPNGTLVTSSESSGLLNTGNLPFDTIPIYVSYSPSGSGTTYFDL